MPKTSMEQKDRSATAPQSSTEEAISLVQEVGDDAMDLSACYDSEEEDMLFDAESGEWDSFMKKILLDSATALATANIGNPLLSAVTPSPSTGGASSADRDWGRPVAGGEGMFSYQRDT